MKKERLVLGGGCFLCTEAVFLNVKGVLSVASGYAGGARANPSYENVCTGATGHAEVIDISYDADVISHSALLDIFFAVHNPTTLNQQGADKGTQYRSVVYYESEGAKESILRALKRAQEHYSDNIVTEISVLPEVYPAEAYHQNYYNKHTVAGYCMAVIAPKLQKFMTKFPQNLG